MREGPGSRRGEAQHLEAVRERSRMTALAAVFDVVMDRMVIAGHRLERGEVGVGDGAAGDVKTVADAEVIEELALGEAMPARVEFFAHRKTTTFSAASREIAASS